MINYLSTSPTPVKKGTDAVFNEMETLKAHFGGHITSLYPFRKPNRFFPIGLSGLHCTSEIVAAEKDCELNHIIAPGLHALSLFKHLSKPIIYSIAAGLPEAATIPPKLLKVVSAFVVSNERDFEKLSQQGVKNIHLIRSGMRFNPVSEPASDTGTSFKLLMASAPWVNSQFKTKGIHLLIKLLEELPDLEICFLWRGLLYNKMKALINQSPAKDRITLVDQRVDVRSYLRKSHATVLLCQHPEQVKAYPHSLIESILAGRPVVLNSAIPMSDFIKERGFGHVIDKMDLESLMHAIHEMKNEYDQYALRLGELDPNLFSQETMIRNFETLYQNALK